MDYDLAAAWYELGAYESNDVSREVTAQVPTIPAGLAGGWIPKRLPPNDLASPAEPGARSPDLAKAGPVVCE
jgi:hypothetical protein